MRIMAKKSSDDTPESKTTKQTSSWGSAARVLRTLKGQQDQTFAVRQTAASSSSDDSLPYAYDTFKGDESAPGVSLEQHYAPIDTYEGKHRYDPKARWTEGEEKSLIRKACIPYSNCDVQTNIESSST